MADSVDPDQMPHSVASDLFTLFAQVCLSVWTFYIIGLPNTDSSIWFKKESVQVQ